jgi:hypothetical protein
MLKRKYMNFEMRKCLLVTVKPIPEGCNIGSKELSSPLQKNPGGM